MSTDLDDEQDDGIAWVVLGGIGTFNHTALRGSAISVVAGHFFGTSALLHYEQTRLHSFCRRSVETCFSSLQWPFGSVYKSERAAESR